MPGKKEKQFLFSVQLNCREKEMSVLTVKNTPHHIKVTTPIEFDGQGNEWSPEQLFLASISSCFVSTYLFFSKSEKLEGIELECEIIGQVEMINEKYRFTNINLFPKIMIASESLREKANKVLEKTHQHCLVAQSVNAFIFYHSEVLIGATKKKRAVVH